MTKDPIVIVSAVRTPLGNMLGSLKDVSSVDLGATAIKAAIERAGIKPDVIQETIMGCVLPAGLGQAPARQAALKAGIPKSVGATTVNKMCGSGMKAIMFAHDLIVAGTNDVVLAGGMESMSNAPYLLAKARAGYRLGHGQLIDHMMLDGLEDAYDKGKSMGVFADKTAADYGFSRAQQDEFALCSLTRAQNAAKEGLFTQEIAPVTISSNKGETIISMDDGPLHAKPEKIPQLKPAFSKDGTVTAANSSSISDGAAALILMRESVAKKLGVKPIAKICGHAMHAKDPAEFTTAPVGAIEKLLRKNDWQVSDVDLFEINEAFAVVTMVALHDLKLQHEKVNIYGGACALGHPIGASGARIIVTLINALQQSHLKRGVAALCIGGGEATAMGIEIV